MSSEAESTESSKLAAVRREKLEAWRSRQVAYPNGFKRTHTAAELQSEYVDASKEDLERDSVPVVVAGRIMLKRVMGKASFLTIEDVSAQIQCYLRKDDLGSGEYDEFRDLVDIGDIVGVSGTLMRTNRGELTVSALRVVLLTKSLLPMPDKYHGLSDREARYRHRYVDLLMSDTSRSVFRIRSAVIAAIRGFLNQRGYLEVETPMLQPLPTGASAEPFVTHHNTFHTDLYLRIAPELYLKRLVVGGFERVYEINRNFRNEGVSTRHNPEFTMLEFYQAYTTYEDMMAITAEMLPYVAKKAIGSAVIEYQGHQIDLAARPRTVTMLAAVAEANSVDETQLSDGEYVSKLAEEVGASVAPTMGPGAILNAVFEKTVEHTLIQPTFVVGYPAEISPLARRNAQNPQFTDRFEMYIAGREIANAFSEINDPDDQADRFREQAKQRERGDKEAMYFDEDFIEALQYGMPPTAGEGLGIDRLVMLLTDQPSIRDVLLFPLMRPESV